MKPRLRSMTLDADRVLLILDRIGPTTVEMTETFCAAARSVGAAGGLVFSGTVDLDNDEQVEGLTIHADELAALRRLSDVVAGTAGVEYRREDRDALLLLIRRAEQ